MSMRACYKAYHVTLFYSIPVYLIDNIYLNVEIFLYSRPYLLVPVGFVPVGFVPVGFVPVGFVR